MSVETELQKLRRYAAELQAELDWLHHGELPSQIERKSHLASLRSDCWKAIGALTLPKLRFA